MSKLQKNWLEWLVFGVSVVLILIVAGLLGWDALNTDDRPPELVAHTPLVVRRDAALEATVEVTNNGDQVAEQVIVEVQLEGGGAGPQRGMFQIDLLPGGASRSGKVIFFGPTTDDVRVEAQIMSFAMP